MLRIGVSGTNWTGKSTLISELAENLRHREVQVIALSDLVERCPHPMLERQTLEASRWMVEEVTAILKVESAASVQIFDRSPLDIMAYTIHAGGDLETDNIFNELLVLYRKFDRVYWLRPGEKWPLNGNRDESWLEFARQVDAMMAQAVERFGLEVDILPEDHDTRFEAIRSFIER